ncbi:hypothetical protein [Planomonospora parontospora]|uniref:hypothetical protein n=1 Tax=Planomonospora parontospora TaxID=58119 RepID=UPI00167125FD|nr:hypothetical protein [Planomonospora parontospora]GGL19744.1 hypothetical protein GCM10014719_22270 [Planomonospora parontospora subsp. antibiotica]GII13699.1 hypothetical protein Ppa05_04250 [Planomonospora parontospora subsp. antibiotica]
MAPISTIITIALVILLFLLILGGAGIYLLVKVGKKATKKARKVTTRVVSHVAAMDPGDAGEAERMRLELRREVSITRQAVNDALQGGWGLGELPQLVAEIGSHADQLDTQLSRYAQQSRVSPYVDHATLARLREHHAKLTTACARIRADLLNDQMAHSAGGIEEIRSRTDLEIEARRQAPIADPLDQIDELYQRTMIDRARPEEPR